MTNSAQQVAFITGGSRGLGAAIARRLASAGALVVINFVEREDAAALVKQDIEAAGGKAVLLRADVCDRQALESAWLNLRAASGIGPVTTLVHSAGAALQPAAFLASDWNAFARHFDVAVQGAFNASQLFLPEMVAAKSGTITLISSAAGSGVPPAQWSPYVTAKAALLGLMRSLAVEFGPHGVRVNAISPGLIPTDLTAFIPDRMKQMSAMQVPLKRLASVDDIAAAVAHLVSSEASFITGVNLPVAGGSVMP